MNAVKRNPKYHGWDLNRRSRVCAHITLPTLIKLFLLLVEVQLVVAFSESFLLCLFVASLLDALVDFQVDCSQPCSIASLANYDPCANPNSNLLLGSTSRDMRCSNHLDAECR